MGNEGQRRSKRIQERQMKLEDACFMAVSTNHFTNATSKTSNELPRRLKECNISGRKRNALKVTLDYSDAESNGIMKEVSLIFACV